MRAGAGMGEQIGDREIAAGHFPEPDMDDGEVDRVAAEVEEVGGGVRDGVAEDFGPECENAGFERRMSDGAGGRGLVRRCQLRRGPCGPPFR